MSATYPEPLRETGHDQSDTDAKNAPPTDVPADAERAAEELAEENDRG